MSSRDRLFRPAFLGYWMAKYPSICQMRLLSDQELGRLATERGLMSLSLGDGVKRLWQLGLLRADLVASDRQLDIPELSLVDRDDRGSYLYTDERLPGEREAGLAGAIERLPEFPPDIDLQFHPFRYYVLYHIERIISSNIHPMQMLWSADGYTKLLARVISDFVRWSSKEESRALIGYWNDITSLAVACEPYTYQKLFGLIRSSSFPSLEEQRRLIRQYWDEFKLALRETGLEYTEKARRELCINAELLDPNQNIQVILRLTRGEHRLKGVRGRLGGAMYLLTMAEMLRRAAEDTFGVELPEEDDLGFGVRYRGVKEKLYGGERIVDAARSVQNEFLRRFGLDYGVRLRWYVEGDTEYHALDAILGNFTGVDLVNLRGNVAARKGKGVAFKDDLRSDLRSSIFSLVSIDGDRSDNLRAVRVAAENDEFCGMFFISNPDFEFGNFTIEELVTVAWQITLENGASEDERERLIEATAGTSSAAEFFKAAKLACPALSQFDKGKVWGMKLMEFAWNNPKTALPDGNTKTRPIVEAVNAAIRSVNADYHFTRTQYRTDPTSGKLVKRS